MINLASLLKARLSKNPKPDKLDPKSVSRLSRLKFVSFLCLLILFNEIIVERDC